MISKSQKFFIVIISIVILLPIEFTLFDITLKKITKKKSKFNLNFKHDFGFKKDLIYLNKLLKEDLFNAQMIPKKSIDLKNGWFVLGDDFGNAFSESKGLLIFNKKQIKSLKDKLIEKNNWLTNKGISFYIAIAPNKLTTYDSLIPITNYNRNTKLMQLDSLCKKLDINFINMGAKFKEYPSLRLYHKTDTHWNGNGGFLGYDVSMDSIRKDFPKVNFKKFKINNIKSWSKTESIGDLNEMLYNPKKEVYIHTDPLKINAEIVQDKLSVPNNYRKDPKNYEIRLKNKLGKLTFLAFRDSFFGYSSHFFSENFEESIYIWNHIFDKQIIEKENPDIVFFELVERNIDFLLE